MKKDRVTPFYVELRSIVLWHHGDGVPGNSLGSGRGYGRNFTALCLEGDLPLLGAVGNTGVRGSREWLESLSLTTVFIAFAVYRDLL